MSLKPVFKIALLSLAFLGLNAIAAQPGNRVTLDNRTTEPAPDALKPLLETINERLNIADLVALTKWDSAKPIQDSDRESQVIANAQQQAATYGIDKGDVGQLLAAQIEANKLVQYGLLAAWQTAGKAPETKRPDLKNQIRPQLDELQTRLLQQYAGFNSFRTHPACSTWLTQARPHLAKDHLHELALIRATGELCIGGTPHA